MSKKKYLPLYRHCVRTGSLPASGLCRTLKELNRGQNDELFNLFEDDCRDGYWAYWSEFRDRPIYTQDVSNEMSWKLQYSFNPLRQNIVLLLAAINGEL